MPQQSPNRQMFIAINHALPRKKWSRLSLGLFFIISRCGIFTEEAVQNPARASMSAIQKIAWKLPVAECMYMPADGAIAMARLLLSP